LVWPRNGRSTRKLGICTYHYSISFAETCIFSKVIWLVELLKIHFERNLEYSDNYPFVNTSNHLSMSFVQSKSGVFHFYNGLRAADGVNSNYKHLVGFGFKSTECLYLFALLKRCGVSAPKIK
jgi:hypothetical protein